MFIAITLIVILVVLYIVGCYEEGKEKEQQAAQNKYKAKSKRISLYDQMQMDKKNWNNGICPHCGYHWTLYQYDEILGRVYVCTRCEEMTNVITNADKNYYTCDDPDHPDYIE